MKHLLTRYLVNIVLHYHLTEQPLARYERKKPDFWVQKRRRGYQMGTRGVTVWTRMEEEVPDPETKMAGDGPHVQEVVQGSTIRLE